MFRRRSRRSASALIAARGSDWLRDSRLRQTFDRDLEDAEQILDHSAVTLTCEKFDRPVDGVAVVTDRALRIRWGLASAVRQHLQIGYERMHWVEVWTDDAASVYLTYFDPARTTVGFYQELTLRAESSDLTLALPHLVSGYHQRTVLPEVAIPEAEEGAFAELEAPVRPQIELPALPARLHVGAGAHRRRRRGLVRR